MSISDKEFENEFDVKNDKLLDMIVDIIMYNTIKNLDMLSVAAKIVKHVE